MIPWDTFKTPQDAYEWAKANFQLAPVTGRDSAWLTPGLSCNNSWFTVFFPGGPFNCVTLPVRR